MKRLYMVFDYVYPEEDIVWDKDTAVGIDKDVEFVFAGSEREAVKLIGWGRARLVKDINGEEIMIEEEQ